MIATHADSLIAEAVVKGYAHTFNNTLALEAVLKDCDVAPVGDNKWEYADREEVCKELFSTLLELKLLTRFTNSRVSIMKSARV